MRSASVLMDKRETRNEGESPVAQITATEESGGAIKSLVKGIFRRFLPFKVNASKG